MVRLQREAIDVGELIAATRADGDGAVATFVGTVRATNAGQNVLFLEYEAYVGMAERELERIEEAARGRFAVSRVAVVHRIGRLEVGEASVAVVVAAPHRAAAMDACRFVIDTLKASVPIWKREHFEGGVVWIEGQGERARS
jgi:molybdopterin synthase catalytic subunit